LNPDENLVCVVIPTYNGILHIVRTLDSVLKSSYPSFKIIVIDDGSTDGTSNFIAEHYPDITVLKGDGNLWWAGAMNMGIRYSLSISAKYVFVLNNDVLIAEDTIEKLVATASYYPDALIGSLIFNLNNKDQIWSAGGITKWPWPGEIQLSNMSFSPGENNLKTASREWFPGMGTLLPTQIISTVGLYDFNNMPQYLADADYCLRALKKGYKAYICFDSKLYNDVENTGGLKEKQRIQWSDIASIFASLRSPDFFKARITFIRRHCPWYLLLPAVFIRYTRLFFFILRRL
jgi:GT2 family glycosyltransferase